MRDTRGDCDMRDTCEECSVRDTPGDCGMRDTRGDCGMCGTPGDWSVLHDMPGDCGVEDRPDDPCGMRDTGGDGGVRDTRSSTTTSRHSIAPLLEGVLPERDCEQLLYHPFRGTRASEGPGSREDLRMQHLGQSALSRDFIHALDFGSRREITKRAIPVNTIRALKTFGISLAVLYCRIKMQGLPAIK